MTGWIKKNYYFLLIFVLYLGMRIPGLGYDLSNSDSLRWHRRSERFLAALKSGNFSETYQHYQPGVTLMWLNSVVKQLGFYVQLSFTDAPKTLENADWFPVVHAYSKLELILVLTLLLVYLLFLIQRLFSKKVSLYFALFIALEPYIVGIDRFFHLTSLETYLSFAAFLSIVYWFKKDNFKYLIISAFLLTLSVLSKSTTLITLPVYAVLLGIKYKSSSNKGLFYFAALCLLFGVILFPAMWVNPVLVVNKLWFGITNAISADSRNIYTGFLALFYYPVVVLLKTSPVFLVLAVFGLVQIRRSGRNVGTLALLFYILLYFLALSVAVKKIDRYSLSLLLPLSLVVSLFVARLNNKTQKMLVVLYLVFSGWVFSLYYPVFSSYYSPLFGGSQGAKSLKVYDNSGEYFAQAALLLNDLGRDTTVFVPNNHDTFFPYYKGNLLREFDDSVNFTVVSSNRLNDVPTRCKTEYASFGTPFSKEVFIFEC